MLALTCMISIQETEAFFNDCDWVNCLNIWEKILKLQIILHTKIYSGKITSINCILKM